MSFKPFLMIIKDVRLIRIYRNGYKKNRQLVRSFVNMQGDEESFNQARLNIF